MGHIRNHSIIVECSFPDYLAKAHAKAVEIFGDFVTPITPVATNGSQTFGAFIVPPDGSKEGWDASTAGDNRREAFKTWLRAQGFPDGGNLLDWVEIRFGGDDCDAKIEDHGHNPAPDAAARKLRV